MVMSVISDPADELLDEQRLAVPRNKAIAISGLSPRQVDYWARSGLVEPAVDSRVSPGRRIRLYGFLDLLALMVAAQLRAEYRISLQHIRRIIEQLVLDLQPLRQRIAEGTRRADDLSGKVEQRRGALGNKPVFAGTRIPVDTVRRYLDAGRSTTRVLAAFPDLTRDDIESVRRGGVA